MSRIFAYVRVSTAMQNPSSQIKEIQDAGFSIEPHRIITEVISGSVPIARRNGFMKLLDRMEKGDVLVVTKLDRLGRNAIDVTATVKKLLTMGIKVHCLALGGIDLTSSAGKVTMGLINVMAEFERDLLIERTQAGLAKARASGKVIGRPKVLSEEQKEQVIKQINEGKSLASIAKDFKVSRKTITRCKDLSWS